MEFCLILPGETVFGSGRLRELPQYAPRLGWRLALARGGTALEDSGVLPRVRMLLAEAGATLMELPPQTREPEADDVDAAVAVARDGDARGVVAVGGGSVIDLGKAVAALIPQNPPSPARAFLEGVGEGRALTVDPLPWLAIPTTAGTGAEATKNAVISSRREGFKKSLRDRRMVAKVALIAPDLALSLPSHLTAWSGMDAVTQLIEAYTTRRAHPATDALALRGLEAAGALRRAVADGGDLAAREAMALAAFLSGVCLANAGLGAAHGIAAGLGSAAPVAHGLACALALPWVMAANLPVAAARYARAASALAGRPPAEANDGAREAIAVIWELMGHLRIPRARALPEVAEVLAEENLPALAARCRGTSLRGNPRELSDEDVIAILRAMRDAEDPLTVEL